MARSVVREIESIFARAPTPVSLIAGDGRILYCNQSLLRLMSIDSVPRGERCHSLFRATDSGGRPLCAPGCGKLRAAMQSLETTSYLMWCEPRGGAATLLEGLLLPITPADGPDEPGVCLQVFRPVNAREQAKSLVKELNGLYGSAPERTLPDASTPRETSPLTRRETEVLLLVKDGLDSKKIAETLGISRTTARNHVQRILVKLKVHSRLEATLAAQSKGWL